MTEARKITKSTAAAFVGAMLTVLAPSSFAAAPVAGAAVDPRFAKPFIDPGHIDEPDWVVHHRITPYGNFDGDGCSELIVRTSDGTVDGTGKVLGDPDKKWVEGHGTVIFAPLWYTVFDGKTGRAIDSITMKPDLRTRRLAAGGAQLLGVLCGRRDHGLRWMGRNVGHVHEEGIWWRGMYLPKWSRKD